MNERIKELMKQSGAYNYYEVNEGVDGDEQPMIKFAELIVRECAEVANENVGAFTPGCGNSVLEHFGVER